MAITKNLVIDQGSTFTANLQYITNNKTPVDLTDYTVKSQMRKSYKSANASATFTTSFINAATGNIQLSLASSITANLKYGRYVYDAKANIGNVSVKIFEGIVTVYPGVTQ